MNLNRIIPRIGAAVVSVTVFLFAVCLLTDFSFGFYFVCMLLPIGYIITAAEAFLRWFSGASGFCRSAYCHTGILQDRNDKSD